MIKLKCFFYGHKYIHHSQEMPNIELKWLSIDICSRCGKRK